MAAIIPVSGKFGIIRFNSFELLLEKWSKTVESELEDYQHFGMTADANGLIFKQQIAGFSTGGLEISGKFDNTPGSYLPTSKTIWPETNATGFIGFSRTVGWNFTGIISNVKSEQGVTPPFGTYSATLKIYTLVFNAAGP